MPPGQVETPLPHPENKQPLDAGAVTMKRIGGGWQVWAGPRVLRTLGDERLLLIASVAPNEDQPDETIEITEEGA